MKIEGKNITDLEIIKLEKIKMNIQKIYDNLKISDEMNQYIKNNVWYEIPDKNLWFNKKIMGCYPNFNTDFVPIYLEFSPAAEEIPTAEKAMDIIKSNEKYMRYGIDWSIPTYNELVKSFNASYPFQKNSESREIEGYSDFLFRANRDILGYSNSKKSLVYSGLLFPVYRVLAPEHYKKLEEKNEVFKFNSKSVLFSLILKDLTPKFGGTLDEEYKHLKDMVDFYKKTAAELKNTITPEELNELVYKTMSAEGLKIFKNSDLEFQLETGDRVRFFLRENLNRVEGEYLYANNDRERCTYKLTDGDNYVKDGESKYSSVIGEVKYFDYNGSDKKEITELHNLLYRDKLRVNLDPYDKGMVLDPNRGDWNIFESEDEKKRIESELGTTVYGRDPHRDVIDAGVVGIDFGTKSTVVVAENGRNITPIRVSGTAISQDAMTIDESQYENPTIIEFKNIEQFLKDYQEKDGRPFTKWKDVTVSHTAYSNFFNSERGDFYSTVSDLKQWAGTTHDKMIVRDEKGVEYIFPAYMDGKEDEIDPIELYAYYIGNYINNMRNRIYLEYFLSFPVTYEKEVRERILNSFKKGIRKSFPDSILQDKEIMDKFKVKHGTSEPAAYAVCALKEYGISENTKENIYYGIFDFGGGTTDFDFGVWKKSDETEKYDYELIHFGASGCKYLGGENILKELSYEVLKKNKEALKKQDIYFYRPGCCENDYFKDCELFLDETPEAKINTAMLMKKLRPLWERCDDSSIGEKIKVGLYDKMKNFHFGVDLEVDLEHLKSIITERIRRGVENFFAALESAMRNEYVDKINVFLAGNSSKHPEVMKIFDENKFRFNGEIEVFPPLGTGEAKKKMEEKNLDFKEDSPIKPNGKTGVAYGILYSIPDGRIKIENRDEKESLKGEKFGFYLGFEKNKKLVPVLTPNISIEKYEFLAHCKGDGFYIYYTNYPEALNNDFPIEICMKKRLRLKNEYEDCQIYIKSISSRAVEYVVVRGDIQDKDYLESGIEELE